VTLFVLIMILTLQIANYAQNTEVKKFNKTNKKMRLLILPSKCDTLDFQPIENEVTSQIVDAAKKLKRFEVIDRSKIMGLQLLQRDGVIVDSLVVKFGENLAVNEALIVNVLDFYQKGIPPDLDDKKIEAILGLTVELLSDDEEDKYSSNVRTELAVQVDKIDIETGLTSIFFNVYAFHTGGNKEKSRAKVMEQVKKSHCFQLITKTASV
jgi:hypothetical protein